MFNAVHSIRLSPGFQLVLRLTCLVIVDQQLILFHNAGEPLTILPRLIHKHPGDFVADLRPSTRMHLYSTGIATIARVLEHGPSQQAHLYCSSTVRDVPLVSPFKCILLWMPLQSCHGVPLGFNGRYIRLQNIKLWSVTA